MLRIQVEHEEDGRWIAGIPALPGALAYGITREEAISSVEAPVLRVLANRLERGEDIPSLASLFAA